jgi:hypothetical protein
MQLRQFLEPRFTAIPLVIAEPGLFCILSGNAIIREENL